MKRWAVAEIVLLAGTLALGACGTVPVVGPGMPQSTDPTVAAIQDAAVKVCGFVPWRLLRDAKRKGEKSKAPTSKTPAKRKPTTKRMAAATTK